MVMPVSEWRITRRLQAAVGTDDKWVALGYGCFLWGALLRCTWLVLDLFSSEALGALMMLLIMPVMVLLFLAQVTAPLADLAGAALAFRRPREPRLLLMALAAALFWSRGWIAPEFCGTAPTTSVGVSQFCEQVARDALGLVVLAACLDRMYFSRRLPGWLRALAMAGAAAWLFVSLDGGDRLSSELSVLAARIDAGGRVPYHAIAEPIRALRDLGGTVAWGLIAILAAMMVLSGAWRNKADRSPPASS